MSNTLSTPKQATNWSALLVLISVFFFWGFVAASNGILIPLFKEKLNLTQTKAQLVDFAFYIAYFVGAMIYLLVAQAIKQDPLNKIGFKNGIVYGLLVSAMGSLLFFPAAQMQSFPLMLAALFVVGLGFSLQQTSAQPLAIALGDASTGAQRLNLAGGVNNFGTTLGPVLLSYAIFGDISQGSVKTVSSIESIQYPYLILGAFFVLFALIFKFSSLPAVKNDVTIEQGFGALKYPQLVLGMVAIFTYVGVEVAIGSNLGEYLKQTEGLDASQISQYVSLFWGSMMIGRWSAAVAVFNPAKNRVVLLKIVAAYAAFLVFLGINTLRGSDVSNLYPYALSIAIMLIANVLSRDKPARQLFIFSSLGVLFMLVGLLTTGKVALYAFMSGGLCCSVLWPCIFTLSIAGLGKFTSQGSALLIAMILGGAIVPPLQGLLADSTNIRLSYIVPAIGFVYLAWFAVAVTQILKRQGIDFEASEAVSGH